MTNTQVMVLSKAPGLAAVDVESRVSFPIEQHLRGGFEVSTPWPARSFFSSGADRGRRSFPV